MRWRGHTMKRMSMIPTSEPAPTDDTLQKMENGESTGTRVRPFQLV